MRAPDAIERSQKKLYLSIKSELALFEMKKGKEILAYEKAYRSSIPRTIRAADKKKLLKEIKNASAVLVGDFHPFRQSQKGFLRLAEEFLQTKGPGKRIVLALECLQESHQPSVNQYLAGYITVEELRDKIDFEKFWPFSWENYREILEFAKKNKLAILALNVFDRKNSSAILRERDLAAAEKVATQILSQPESIVFLLYGELHLARPHLPADLRARLGKKKKVLVVHQNDANLYWKVPKQKNGQRPEVLQLSAQEFCILNSVPWVKLRSYLDWLEGNPDAESWEGGLDVAGTVHQYAQLLSEAIGLRSFPREDIEILGPESLERAGAFAKKKSRSAFSTALLRHSLQFQRTGYLPFETIVLPTVSTNSLSEAAAFLLRHSQRGSKVENAKPLPLHFMAHFFLGYLGSKILNPKRKCNEVADLKTMVQKDEKRIQRNQAKLAARALALLRPYLKHEALPKNSAPLLGANEIEACRLAGYVLGERFFLSILRNPGQLALLRAWFQSDSSVQTRSLLIETAAKICAISRASKQDLF